MLNARCETAEALDPLAIDADRHDPAPRYPAMPTNVACTDEVAR